MDAAVGKILGEVLGHDPPPLQHHRRGVVHGVEGPGILPLPAEAAQGAAPAYPLRRPVEDDGGILLAGPGCPAHAVIQLPQRPRRLCQPLLQLLPDGGRVSGLLPFHPLPAEQPPGQSQEQSRSQSALQHQWLRQRFCGGQQAHQRRGEKNQRGLHPLPARAFARQQPRQAQPGGEHAAARPGAKVRRQSQTQTRRRTHRRSPLIGGAGQQHAQQRPPHGDSRHFQVRQAQQHRRSQKQQPIGRGAPVLRAEYLPEEPGGSPGQSRRRHAGRQVPQRRQGLENVDARHCQEQSRRRYRHGPGPGQPLAPLKGGGGGEDQHPHRQKGQRVGEVQEQQCPQSGPRQGGGAVHPRSRRRHQSQGEGGIAPRRLAGGQRRRQE